MKIQKLLCDARHRDNLNIWVKKWDLEVEGRKPWENQIYLAKESCDMEHTVALMFS